MELFSLILANRFHRLSRIRPSAQSIVIYANCYCDSIDRQPRFHKIQPHVDKLRIHGVRTVINKGLDIGKIAGMSINTTQLDRSPMQAYPLAEQVTNTYFVFIRQPINEPLGKLINALPPTRSGATTT